MNFLKIFALIFTIITSCVGDHEEGDRDQYKDQYCESKKIIGSNIESEFAKITKCHVIEGHLRLHRCTLPEGAVFPNLTQVTGYIILERVEGLYSLAKLFPKLVIIRGEELFDKYALILHGNLDLVEIGPSVLSSIHGAVHVEDNVMMCTDDRELNKLVEGRYQNYNVMKNNLDFCPFIGCEEDGYCKVRERSCKSLGLECPTKKNCPSECIGGCYESSNHSTSCVACKNFESDKDEERKCLKNCPKGYLNFMNYRCLTWEECTSMGGSVLYPNNIAFLDEVTRKGKMYQKNKNDTRCIKDCPKKFIKEVSESGKLFRICELRQVCETTIITNTNFGENLQHCKQINGNLIILVSGGKNVIEHLTKNLEKIENITGYLKVAGSNALYSLSFLSNLKSIEGKERINRGEHHQGYSLYLTENSNLKELFDFDFRPAKQLEIDGSVYIHYNENLCNREIEKFLEVAKIKNGTITNNTNRNCHLFETHLKAVPGSKNGTILVSFVHNHCTIDNRLLVYQIFYRPVSKTENVSKYHKRDVCDDKLFKRGVVELPGYLASCVEYEIKCLTPNTRYAIYIESFALDDNIKDKIESSIVYATTYSNIEKPNTGKLELKNDSILLSYKHPKVPSYIVPDEIFYEVILNIYGDPVKKENVTEKELVPVAESECKCSTLSTFFIKDQIRESLAIENEISGLLFYRSIENSKDNKHDASSSRTKRTTESSKKVDTSSGPCLSCVCFLKSDVFPNAHEYSDKACKAMMSNAADCKKPNVNYTLSSFTFKKSILKSECEGKDKIYCKTEETKNTSISISLPNASVMPENISVSVRTCIRKMKPCPPLESEESCSICSDFLTLTIDNNSEAKLDDLNDTYIIYLISAAFVALLVLSIVAILYPKIANKNNSRDLKTCRNEYYHLFMERFKESYIPPDLLEISSNILGEGDFGKVYEACIAKTKKKIQCAVKTINPEGKCDRLDEFWDEESIMMKLDNFFIVKLYHTSLHEILGFCFAMELMKMNLSKYIITHTHSLTEKEMVEILVQVAFGMKYLHSKNIVFRDLASRNVLIKPNTEENLPIICKISDFGFARELHSETKEYVIKRRFVPRLAAPEAIKGCYTLPSDVYSFGILIYECLMTECIDKPDKECTDEEIKKMVPKIELPLNLPQDLKANHAFLTSIMNKTQKDDPKERPTFADIVKELCKEVSVDFVNWCEFQFEFGNIESLDSASNSFNDNSISASTLEACENEQDSESDCNDNACLSPKECSWNNSSCLSINCIQDTIYCTKKLFSKSEKDEHSFPQDRMY